MKEETRNKILFSMLFVMFTLSSISEVFATASITISPTSGPVGTTITINGNGFEPFLGNNVNQTLGVHGFQATQNYTNYMYGEPFQPVSNTNNCQPYTNPSGCTYGNANPVLSGSSITQMGFNVANTGIGSFNGTDNKYKPYGGSTTGWQNYGWCGSSFISSLNDAVGSGSQITSLNLNVTALSTGFIQAAVYYSGVLKGTTPVERFDRTGVDQINFTNVGSFWYPDVPPANVAPGFTVCFETNDTTMGLATTGLAGGWPGFSNAFPGWPINFPSVGCEPIPPYTPPCMPYPWTQVTVRTLQTNAKFAVYNSTGHLLGSSSNDIITHTGAQSFSFNTPFPIGPSNSQITAAFMINNTYAELYASDQKDGITPAIEQNYSVNFPTTFPSTSALATWAPFTFVLYSTQTPSINFTQDNVLMSSLPSNVNTNSTGGFSGVTVNALAQLIGAHTIKAEDPLGASATKTFTITLPSVTSLISGNVILDTSSITPNYTLSTLPSVVFDVQQQLYRNGTLIQTLGNLVDIPTATTTNGNIMGEQMIQKSGYYVNTTLQDGVNQWVIKSNTITLGNNSNNTPSQGKQCSIDYCPTQSLVNYTVHRTPDYKTLIMTVNLQPIPFHTECNIINGTFQNHHKWFNYTGVNAVNFSTHVPYNDNAYYACYGSGPILSGVSPGNGTLVVQGANVFNQTIGVSLGVPVGTFFIALIASLANQRTGPIYVIVVLGVTGIMAALLFFTIPNGAWALELIVGFLGLFVGRKIY